MNYSKSTYTTEVRDLAIEAITMGGEFSDNVHELVDAHELVIYYHGNDLVMQYTDNPDAWQDIYSNEDIGALVADKGLEGAKTVQAYFAMERDVCDCYEQALEIIEDNPEDYDLDSLAD